MQVAKDLDELVCTTVQAAALLKISVQHFGLLQKQGVVRRVAPNRWRLVRDGAEFRDAPA